MIWLGLLLGALAREVFRWLFSATPAPSGFDPAGPMPTIYRVDRDVPADISVAVDRDRAARWN